MDCVTPSNICFLRALKLYGFPELHLIVMHEYHLLIHFLKKIKKHGSKYRSIMFSLQNTWGNFFNVLNVGADTENNYIKFFSLHWARAVHEKVFFYMICFLLDECIACMLNMMLSFLSFVFMCMQLFKRFFPVDISALIPCF